MRSILLRAAALAALCIVAALAAGCRSAQGTTPEDKRDFVLDMRKEALARLYSEEPASRAKVANASGYGVFSSFGAKLLFASSSGFGVVRDAASGSDTYMRMQELGVGIGLGVKDTRIVIVFHDPKTLRTFVDKGWQWGGDADAAARYDEQGMTANVGANLRDGMEVYVMTEAGVALQATVTGTKYWKDTELNAR